MNIFFYYPEDNFSSNPIPERSNLYVRRNPGKYVWVVKTYAILESLGFSCEVTSEIPEEGIIVAHRDVLADSFIPSPSQYCVCVVADTYRHPYAQFHLVQNPTDPILAHDPELWPSSFIRHWPESGLVPRDPGRGNRVENVRYYGLPKQLASQLKKPEWGQIMRNEGFDWKIVDPGAWNDYSETDVVVAVRSFSGKPFRKHPATKLYNCWLAGVPAVLGAESAFQHERKSSHDFLEAASCRALLENLCRLRDEAGLYESMVANGTTRRKGLTNEEIGSDWIRILQDLVCPRANVWKKMSERERGSYFHRRLRSYRKFRVKDVSGRALWYVRDRLAEFSGK